MAKSMNGLNVYGGAIIVRVGREQEYRAQDEE